MSFINSIFLFATAAAVIPIAIHLVRRMKARTVPFSSLMFLKATPRELVRRRRLRDRLLMALRCSLLLLLALAFARPYIPAEKIPLVSTREHESIVLLLDRSYSMQYDDHFERAKQLARDRIGSASEADEITIIAFDDRVHVLGEPGSDRTAASAALGALEPSYRTTDYFPALQRAQEILQEARHERRVVALISDLQHAGWSRSLEDWEFEESIIFEPVAVGSGQVDNGFIEAFELRTKTTGGEGIARLDARISGVDGEETEVELILDGSEAERDVLQAGRTTVSFQQAYARTGYHQGVLSLQPDALPTDDAYYFTDLYEGRPQILIVDPNGAGWTSDAFFVRHAFDLGESSLFDVEQSASLQPGSLDRADVVFLNLAGALTDAQVSSLIGYVERGGALIVSMSPGAGPGRIAGPLASLGVGRLEEIVDARSELGYEAIIGDVDLRHPIFEPFGSSGSSAILLPRFRRYARLSVDDAAHVLGSFDSGDPFLVQRDVGRGRILFYASTFGTSWTDMPLDEMYVPFLYELVAFARGSSEDRMIFTVGESVALAGRPGGRTEVRAPDGSVYTVDLDADGRGIFRQTDTPGHYRADGSSGTQYFSINVDSRESTLSFRGAEEVYAALTPRPSNAPITPAQAVAAVQEEERDQKLWRWLLLLVIALFALETYMANRPREMHRVGKGKMSEVGR